LATPLVVALSLGPLTTRVGRTAQAVGAAVPWIVMGAALLVIGRAVRPQGILVDPDVTFAGIATMGVGMALALICLRLAPIESDPLPLRAFLPWRVLWRWIGTGRLNPISLLFGPIFQKEMRVAGRKKATYFERGGYVLLITGFVILIYVATRDQMESSSGASRITQLQALAPSITMTVAILQALLICLAAPLSMASSINEERTSRTMASLMTTPLTSLEIIVGKIVSRGVQLTLMAVLSTPLLLAIRIYGGVQTEAIVAALAITLSVAFMGASVGVLASVLQKRTLTATFSSIAIVVLIEFAPLMIFMIMMVVSRAGGGGVPPQALLATCAPVAFGMSMVMLTGLESGPGVSAQAIWMGTSIYHIVLGCLFIAIAVFALRRLMLADASGSMSTDRRLLERNSRTVSNAPVLWRELRQSLVSGWKLVILLLAVFGLFGFAVASMDHDREAIYYLALVIGTLTTILQAATLAAGGVSAEREARTLDVLLTTPLRPLEILGGKMIGAIRRQWLVPCLTILIVGVGIHLRDSCHPFVLLHLPVLFASTIILLAGTGTLFSVLFTKSRTAATVNLGLAIVLWAGVPFGLAIFGELLGWRGGMDGVLQVVFF
ncbi:MAG: ABC transporter permease subunit, partial [Phycisphaerales bacterium]|nr:ABC transporter permease subunit [Phycisphaerales bacterium]